MASEKDLHTYYNIVSFVNNSSYSCLMDRSKVIRNAKLSNNENGTIFVMSSVWSLPGNGIGDGFSYMLLYIIFKL